MADLLETSQWVDGIYQIEQTDPVVGGPPDLPLGQGIANAAAQQLADRTLWLKNQLASTTSAAALLTAIKTVDGAGSGIDADKLDGHQASYFATKAELDALAGSGLVVQADIDAAIDALIGGAPGALNTLNELAAAMADDASFAASVTASLSGKLGTGDTAADATLFDGNAVAYFAKADRALVPFDATSDPSISALVSGTSSGRKLEGGTGSHVVIGIKGNNDSDGFSVIDTGNAGAADYAQILFEVANSKFKYKGSNIWHAGNDDPLAKAEPDYEHYMSSWTVNTAVTLVHGLGAVPRRCEAVYVCKIADGGWSVGDEIPANHDTYNNRAVNIGRNATTLRVATREGYPMLYVPTNNNTTTFFVITDSTKWGIRVRAWA